MSAHRPRSFALLAAVALATLGLAAGSASAQRAIALAPLATMGNEDTSSSARATSAELERAIAALPATKLISPAQLSAALKRAKRPALASCDGELLCVAEAGQAAGAQIVVTGQSGGLGEARVIYLRAVDTAARKELGSTTWTAGPGDSGAAAITRLLDPAGYTGKLALTVMAQGSAVPATVYVNGKRLGSSTTGAFTLPIGTKALRVTNPEYRDFVRFVDITYAATTSVDVELSPLPVVQRDVTGHLVSTGPREPSPWYRSWWAIAGGATALAVIAGAIAYSTTDGFDPDVTLPALPR